MAVSRTGGKVSNRSRFNSIHVAHALVRAGQKGFDVPDEMRQGALNYLRDIESHYPTWYSQQTRWTLSAYALYVRNLSGDRMPKKPSSCYRMRGWKIYRWKPSAGCGR